MLARHDHYEVVPTIFTDSCASRGWAVRRESSQRSARAQGSSDKRRKTATAAATVMSGSLPDPNGYGALLESGSRGDGDSRGRV